MKLIIFIITMILSVIYAQDRSLIFTTGAPLGSCNPSNNPCNTNGDCLIGETCDPPGSHTIEFNGTTGTSLSDRIYINNNMVLEALKIYAKANTAPAMARVALQTDEGGLPGEEIYSWILDVEEENHGNNYFLIVTTDLCIYLDAGNYYWLTLHADDPNSQISWYYSNNSTFTYTTSSDQGTNWGPATTGNCGSLSVWAEYIYESEVEETVGDINGDGSVNVLDVVILANAVLTGDDLPAGDINGDGVNNVLDIVGLVNIILNGPSYEQLPTWDYVDINTNSDYFDQLIGPDIFNGNVSLYYFGKAGWSMCRHRFGVLNDMYNELQEEGYTEVNIIGINGFQYLDNDYHCMICDTPDECSSCDEERILPWVQDLDDDDNDEIWDDEDGDGEPDESYGDVWESWEISLRDLVVLDRDGNYITRLNLTSFNPDPTALGECTGNYDTIKDLIISLY